MNNIRTNRVIMQEEVIVQMSDVGGAYHSKSTTDVLSDTDEIAISTFSSGVS